jgi:hypothetical protein
MWKINVVLMLMLLPTYVFGFEYLGVWFEDKVPTIEFNTKYSKMTDEESQFLRCGGLRIEYQKSQVISQQEEYTCVVNGKKIEVPGFRSEYGYNFVSINKNEVVVETTIEDGVTEYEVLHFIDKNSFWVYTGEAGLTSDLHTRMFFRREKVSAD